MKNNNLPLILDGPTLGAINQVIDAELNKYKKDPSIFAVAAMNTLSLFRGELNKTKEYFYDKRHGTFLKKAQK